MRKSSRIALVLAGGVLAGLVAAGYGWNRWTHRKLDAAKARIRAAKLPVTVDEVRPPSLPEEKNAAPLIAKVARLTSSAAYKGEAGKGVEDDLLKFREL